MYAQISYLEVPMNQMSRLRNIIEARYLPVISLQPGFRAGYLLEQEDDPDTAELVFLWDDQAAVERFNRTGTLEAAVQSLSAAIPGLFAHRRGFVVKVMTQALVPAGVG
jgi:heme-degrading monooxygenase HmoA